MPPYGNKGASIDRFFLKRLSNRPSNLRTRECFVRIYPHAMIQSSGPCTRCIIYDTVQPSGVLNARFVRKRRERSSIPSRCFPNRAGNTPLRQYCCENSISSIIRLEFKQHVSTCFGQIRSSVEISIQILIIYRSKRSLFQDAKEKKWKNKEERERKE